MPTYQKTSTTIVTDFAEPELFFQYKGVKISHTYIENTEHSAQWVGNINGGREASSFAPGKISKRLFSTNRKCGFVPRFDDGDFDFKLNRWNEQPKNETRGVFNIQNIPNPNGHHITTFTGIQRVLIEAIDSGWIKANQTPECVHDCHIIVHPS